MGVNVGSLASGTYNFTLTYSRAGQSVPSAKATGTFTVTNSTLITLTPTATAAVAVPTPTLVTAGAGATVSWTATNSSATATVSILVGGSWTIYNATASGGVFSATIPSLAAGTYQYEIEEVYNNTVVSLSSNTLKFTPVSNSVSYEWPGTARTVNVGASQKTNSSNPNVTFTWSSGGSLPDFWYAPSPNTANIHVTVSGSNATGFSAAIGALAPGVYNFALETYVYRQGEQMVAADAGGSFQVYANGTAQIIGTPTIYNGGPSNFGVSATGAQTTIETDIAWSNTVLSQIPRFWYRVHGSGSAYTQVNPANSAGSYLVQFYNLVPNTYDFMAQNLLSDGSTIEAETDGTFTVSSGGVSISQGQASPLPIVPTFSGTTVSWSPVWANGDSVLAFLNNSSATPAYNVQLPLSVSGNTVTVNLGASTWPPAAKTTTSPTPHPARRAHTCRLRTLAVRGLLRGASEGRPRARPPASDPGWRTVSRDRRQLHPGRHRSLSGNRPERRVGLVLHHQSAPSGQPARQSIQPLRPPLFTN